MKSHDNTLTLPTLLWHLCYLVKYVYSFYITLVQCTQYIDGPVTSTNRDERRDETVGIRHHTFLLILKIWKKGLKGYLSYRF